MATSPPQTSANSPSTAAPEGPAEEESDTSAPADQPAQPPRDPELRSGHRLGKRYRLEECITRLDGFSSWRAVDEKLRRAVGIHVLSADHARATAVLGAARSAALLGDPRFVQVLDAAEEKGLVHVIHEWLPDATPLSTVLQGGPLDAHEAQALAGQVSQALTAAHREGLAHLRLTPATVLRTGPGQYRIRGLAVDAALRGISSSRPRRADTEAIGAILYASLTQRWPYGEGAYGLAGVAELAKGAKDPLATPDQLRAGVHRGLSDLAMRALNNDGATATRQEPPCTTPEELAAAIAELPRIPPPDPTPTSLRYRPAHLGSPHRAAPTAASSGPPPAPAPPTLPGRTGTALKWGVSALLLAALALGSWQLADALLEGDSPAEPTEPTAPVDEDQEAPAPPQPLSVTEATDFDPFASPPTENSDAVPNAFDGDPETFWHTEGYYGPNFGNLKAGLGLILDLGEVQEVNAVQIEALGETAIELRAAPSDVTERPTHPDDFAEVASGSGESLTLEAEEPVETRFVLVWLTDLPQTDDGNYRGRITDITVLQ